MITSLKLFRNEEISNLVSKKQKNIDLIKNNILCLEA